MPCFIARLVRAGRGYWQLGPRQLGRDPPLPFKPDADWTLAFITVEGQTGRAYIKRENSSIVIFLHHVARPAEHRGPPPRIGFGNAEMGDLSTDMRHLVGIGSDSRRITYVGHILTYR